MWYFVPALIGKVSHFICYLDGRYVNLALANTYRTKIAIVPPPFSINFIKKRRCWNIASFFRRYINAQFMTQTEIVHVPVPVSQAAVLAWISFVFNDPLHNGSEICIIRNGNSAAEIEYTL